MTGAATQPALIGLGSNLGDREATLLEALARLRTHEGVEVRAVSRLIETEPVGGPPQDDFLNGAALLETSLSPRALLRVLQAIERSLGRVSGGERWGPRPLDLDLLLHGDAVLAEPGLDVPHPRMHERRFVLDPAAEIAPDMLHPTLRRTVGELLGELLGELMAGPAAERCADQGVDTGPREEVRP